jgi:WD40 repeat protein
LGFLPDQTGIISASWDSSLRLWRFDNLAQLIEWTCEFRLVQDLSAEQRARFQIAADAPAICPA